MTERDHLIAAAKATGSVPEELVVEPLPSACVPLWTAFTELHTSRLGGMGATAISYTELAHWQTVNGVDLTPWEVETLKALDLVALKALEAQQKSAMQRKSS